MERKLKEIYYDTTNAASFGNGEVLFRSLQLSPKKISDVEDWMRKQNVHTLHKPVTRKFRRRKVIVGGIDHQWQCDLVDVKSFKNRNIRFLLTVVDVFSRYAWVELVPDKTNSSMIKAFSKIFSKSKRKPFKLQSDHGGEFTGKAFHAFLKTRGVEWFSTRNMETKATIVERFN
jgi:transposase InsO family protein